MAAGAGRGLPGGGAWPSLRLAPAPAHKPAKRGIRFAGTHASVFCFRVAAMAVANSSPVNPVVFFDVSIGGQVRSMQPRRRRDTSRNQPGRSHPPRDSGLENPGNETGPEPTDLRGRGTGTGRGEVLPILAPRSGRDWTARKERLWRWRW